MMRDHGVVIKVAVSLYCVLLVGIGTGTGAAKSAKWPSEHNWLPALLVKLDKPRLTQYLGEKSTEIVKRLGRYPNYFYHTPEHSLATAREAANFVSRYFEVSGNEVKSDQPTADTHAVVAALAGLTHDLFNDGTLEKRTYQDPDGTEFFGYFNKRGGHENEERSAAEFAKLMQGANDAAGQEIFTKELIEKGKTAIMGTKVVGFHSDGPIVLERKIDDADPIGQGLATADLVHLVGLDLKAMVDEALRVWAEDRIDVQHYLHGRLERKHGKGALANDRRYLFDLLRHMEGQQRMVRGEYIRWGKLLADKDFDPQMKEMVTRDYEWLSDYAEDNPNVDDLVHSMNAFNKELHRQLDPLFAKKSTSLPDLDDLLEDYGRPPLVLEPTALPE